MSNFVLLIVSIGLILFYTNGQEIDLGLFEALLWGLLVGVILLKVLQDVFGVDISASIKNIFTNEPEIDIIVNTTTPIPENTFEKQVYHIPENKYTYTDAKAVCSAFGGKLANWKQLNRAFIEGADWCGYGWSADQMALYPTQYEKWQKLQTIKGHEHDCGRPGINGGFIKNPNAKFGINCYGYKPEITPHERDEMNNKSIYPLTKQDIAFQKRVKHYRKKLPSIKVAPFNSARWDE